MNYIRKNPILLLVIIPAFILTLIRYIFDGQNGCVLETCGFIIGSNYRDGIWFQAVSAVAFRSWPFQMPNYAGQVLTGYHYVPNLITYLLTYIGISVQTTYYKLIPTFFLGALTLMGVSFARKIHDEVSYVLFFLFFTFFGMHLAPITSLFHYGEIRNNALINTFQATRLLESPHTALALLLLLGSIMLLYKSKRSIKDVLIISLLLFLTFGTKFYVAFSLSTILLFFELITALKSKNIKVFVRNALIYTTSSIIAFILFYDPLNSLTTNSIFIFDPFSTVHHLLETPDLFYNNNLVLARYYLYEHGWSPRLIGIEFLSVFLFITYYFGTRIIGFILLTHDGIKRKLSTLDISISVSVIVSIAASVLFIQRGDWFNPIQFAVPAAFLMNIYAAKMIYTIYKRRDMVGYIIVGIIVTLTFVGNLINLSYLTYKGRQVIPKEEMEALGFLKQQPDGIVFAPKDEYDMAYVAVFTGKQTYLNMTNVLENAGIDYQKRKGNIEIGIFDDSISYYYIPHNNEVWSSNYCPDNKLALLYSNNSVDICTKE